jgi:CYTH domain-containing protein
MNPVPHTMTVPKYARIEYERRFLVDPTRGWQRNTKRYYRLFEDRYLACGRLRVRRIEDSDTGRVAFKLTKKFESDSTFAQPVVSVWLSLTGYEALASLPGHNLSKTRYYDECEGLVFSIRCVSRRIGWTDSLRDRIPNRSIHGAMLAFRNTHAGKSPRISLSQEARCDVDVRYIDVRDPRVRDVHLADISR